MSEGMKKLTFVEMFEDDDRQEMILELENDVRMTLFGVMDTCSFDIVNGKLIVTFDVPATRIHQPAHCVE